jgi:hypothetical protein
MMKWTTNNKKQRISSDLSASFSIINQNSLNSHSNSTLNSESIFQKALTSQQLYNKCSSYIQQNIDSTNQTMNQQQQHKSTKKNIKKIKSAVSKKLRKFHKLINLNLINHNREQQTSNGSIIDITFANRSAKKSTKNSNIQLTGFNYNHSILQSSTSTKKRRLSTGSMSSSSSSSSISSNDNDQHKTVMPSISNELFISASWGTFSGASFVTGPSQNGATSTPLASRSNIRQDTSSSVKRPILNSLTSTNCRRPRTAIVQIEADNDNDDESFSVVPIRMQKLVEDDDNDNDDDNIIQLNLKQFRQFNENNNNLLDDSTQVNCDEPLLSESTFDTSSLSNLSDDLIILQTNATISHQTPKIQQSDNKNRLLPLLSSKSTGKIKNIVKSRGYFHDNNNTSSYSINNGNNVPQWAIGNALNLAVVNQLYYNPNGQGVFNNSANL